MPLQRVTNHQQMESCLQVTNYQPELHLRIQRRRLLKIVLIPEFRELIRLKMALSPLIMRKIILQNTKIVFSDHWSLKEH